MDREELREMLLESGSEASVELMKTAALHDEALPHFIADDPKEGARALALAVRLHDLAVANVVSYAALLGMTPALALTAGRMTWLAIKDEIEGEEEGAP